MQIGKKIQKWVWVFLVGSLVLILALPGSATASPTINYSLSLPLTCNQCKFLPPPQIGQEILNPDFESGATGWTFYVSTGNPILNNYQAHSPAHSAELGIYIDPNNPEPS